MPRVNLSGMNVGAPMSLRDQVDKRLVELRSELEKELATFGGAKSLRLRASVTERHEGPAEIS